MRVPTLEASVDARPVATRRPDLRPMETGASDMWAGLDRALGSTGQAVDRIGAQVAKAKQQGRALSVAEASLQSEDGWAAVDLEHQKLKGTSASANRAKAYEALDDVRKKTAEGIADPTARTEYLTRSAQRLADYHRRIDSHTLREADAAGVSAEKALVTQALGAAAAADPGQHALGAQAEAYIRIRNPDAGDALVTAFRSDMAFARMKATALRGDVEGAKAFLESETGRKQLGGHFEEATNFVTKAERDNEKRVAKAEADGLAEGILAKARHYDANLDGDYLDGPAAQAAVIDAPEASRSYVRTLVNEQVAADAKRKKAGIDSLKNDARVALNHGKSFSAIPADLISKLEGLGQGEYVDKLKDDANTDARRELIRSRGNNAEKNALAKEQKQADKMAKLRFQKLFLTQQAEENVADFVVGQGVSPEGVLEIEVLKRKAKEHVDNGMASDGDAFTRYAANEAKNEGIAGGKRPMSDEKQAEFSAEAQRAWSDFVTEKKRAPLLAEQNALLDPLLADVVTRNAYWFDSKEKGFEVLAREHKANPRAPAPQKVAPGPPVKMRFPDGSVHTVPQDKVEAARRKGGVPVTP